MTDQAVQSGRLNVEDFVKARRAEIGKLENQIANASGKKRTFQTVPRTLRRRTASHNPKRVPKRMRARALEEYNKDKPIPPKKKRKIVVEGEYHEDDLVGINKLADLPQGKKYTQRQKAQVWLPTHIWHRKRAKMTCRWTYVVPTAPTQKQYRVNHRVLNLAKDAALVWDTSYYGTMVVEAAASALNQWFPGVSKPIYASRSWQGVAMLDGAELGPCLVYTTGGETVINAHPSIYESLFASLPFEKRDLRFAVGSIDLIGSRAMTTLCRALPSEFWHRLGAVQHLDSLPWHGVLATSVYDPRFSYPPQKKPIKADSDNVRKALNKLFGPRPTTLFGDGRSKSYANKPTQKQIEERRQPGETIEPTDADPQIPLVLFKLDDARVRLMLPWHWVLPVWLSIVDMPQVFIGGTTQFEQLAFEQSLHQFPKDYPFTAAGAAQAKEKAELRRASQAARPKRMQNLVADAGGDPFESQWDLVKDHLKPVSVHVLKRGAPADNARIFDVQEDSVVHSSNGPEFMVGKLLGFVTSGAYNLTNARGSGVGYASKDSGYVAIKNCGQSEKMMLAKIEPKGSVYL